MKNVNLKRIATSALAALTLAGTAHAQVAGGSSDTSHNDVGVSSAFGPTHPTAGVAGLSASATGLSNFVAFQDLKNDGSTDALGVTTINNPTTGPNDHQNLGLFHFARVASNDIWFGEWTSNATSGSTDHTVYYAGTTTGTTVPTSGTASYSVKGISDYAAHGLLSGTFNATFGSGSSGTLTGSLSGTGYAVNIGTAHITGSTFTNSGSTLATATNGSTTLASNGVTSGRFYGNTAAALAGIVDFGSGAARQYSAAFGGTKN